MYKRLILVFFIAPLTAYAQQPVPVTKKEKELARHEKLMKMIEKEESGALIYDKQTLFGIKANTDGLSVLYESGKFKTTSRTNIWWLELGERKDPKQEKITSNSIDPNYGSSISTYVFGKKNNFYYLKSGFGRQVLIGNKGNKNGVSITGIYGGGLVLGMLKPYYLQYLDDNNNIIDLKYNDTSIDRFLDQQRVNGASGFTKGLNEIKFVPGWNARTAIRFDYGKYNEVLSALEIGLVGEYYYRSMPIMVGAGNKQWFLQAYVALEFGKRQ